MKIRNNQNGRFVEISESEFLERFWKEISAAEDSFLAETSEGREWARQMAAGMLDDDAQSPFWGNLVENFNQYGATWTSPRGVEQIFEILK